MDYFEKFGFAPSEEKYGGIIKSVAETLDRLENEDVYKKCFSLMDLTTLKSNDTIDTVRKFVGKANGIKIQFPEYPMPASVCVFSNFASVVKAERCSEDLHVTAVSACFPTSQSFLEVKLRECEMAVEAGADEIDVVLALNAFLANDYETASNEIVAIKNAIDAVAGSQGRKVVLKVILETGLLVTPENIARASFLAMEAGADFIKTSTGKVDVNATPMAACIMCDCIAAYYRATGKKVGFKAAGGISTAKDALCYYGIVSAILGESWLDKALFRFGVSRLGNNLMSAIEQKTVNYF